jgi:hypothetical protein
MEDKKNIIIKLKYPTSDNKAKADVHRVTEWNIKRILLALAGVVLLVSTLLFSIKPDTEKPVAQAPTPLPAKAVNSPVKPEITVNSNNISRALLTFGIKHNEPVDEIILPLKLSKDKATSVFYFVELTGMKGQTVYHEWLLDGKLITRKKVHITDDDKWRTFSRQLFAYNSQNNWTARLVDETGQVLNEIPVNVVYE